MSFTISNEKEEDLELLQITDSSGGIQVRILPSVGALLHEFSIPSGNRRIQVVSHYKNGADLRAYLSLSYKGAKLSPFVCRIADGKYSFGGRSYEFENKFKDGTAIHGLLFDKPFRITQKTQSDTEASVTLTYDYNKDDPAYPFEYSIQITYILQSDGRLFLNTVVRNLSQETIPIADGWHPYFQLEGDVNDWLLSFRSRKNVAFDERLIPTGELVQTDAFYSPRPIGETFFDHCFLLEAPDGRPSVTLENPATGLRLLFFPDPQYPYLQIYTPRERDSIAVENLSAAPDTFNNHMGLILLGPGDSQSFSVLYQLKLA